MTVNHKKIRRLMREHELQPKIRRRYVATTDSAHDQPIFPNLAKEMVVAGPDELAVAGEGVGRHGADRRAKAPDRQIGAPIYGQKSERSVRLLDQLSLELEELEASATEDEFAAEQAIARTTTVAGFERKRPERDTWP